MLCYFKHAVNLYIQTGRKEIDKEGRKAPVLDLIRRSNYLQQPHEGMHSCVSVCVMNV